MPPSNSLAGDATAAAFLKAGINSFTAHDSANARVCFGLAKKLFEESGDKWNARIARDWITAVTTKEMSR